MKILIFEYISGGGFNQQALPESLAKEGCLMLQALLDNFAQLPDIELTVMLDSRLLDQLNTSTVRQLILVNPDTNVEAEFAHHIANVDAVWPIAPEFDSILEKLCLAVHAQDKLLLTSPACGVEVTGDKYLCYQRLIQHQIPTVPTQLANQAQYSEGEWIIKPRDGAGCGDSFILTACEALATTDFRSPQSIIQPHLLGDKTSLSCLFKNGKSWILSVNQQGFEIVDRQYQLKEIVVNSLPLSEKYQILAEKIAQVFPELWGYAGIDLIETPEEIRVLEINPRLTTSFAAILAARGLNIAQLILQLLQGNPVINPSVDQAITLNLH